MSVRLNRFVIGKEAKSVLLQHLPMGRDAYKPLKVMLKYNLRHFRG